MSPKKIHKKSALTTRLKQQAMPKRIVSDARVLDLRGPVPGVVVSVPLALLPAWLDFHQVDVVGGKRAQGIVIVKRIQQERNFKNV